MAFTREGSDSDRIVAIVGHGLEQIMLELDGARGHMYKKAPQIVRARV